MAKYNWTVDTLQLKIEELRKAYAREENEDLKNLIAYDINNLETWIDAFYDTEKYDMEKFTDIFKVFKSDITSLAFLWSDYEEFYRESKDPKIREHTFHRSSLSKDDLITLTHDFYKSLNRYFFGNFMKNFRHRRDHVVFLNDPDDVYCGEAISIKYTNEAFLSIGRFFTIEDYLTTIHEFAHATSFQINPNHVDYDKRAFSETIALFMELLASDYYLEQTKDYDASIYKINTHLEYIDNAQVVNLIIYLIKKEQQLGHEYTSTKEMRQQLTKDSFSDEIFDDAFLFSGIAHEEYLASYMYAIELYMLYKENKDKALDLLKRMILLDEMNEEEYYSNIKKLGIIPNFSLRSFERDLQQESIKLERVRH